MLFPKYNDIDIKYREYIGGWRRINMAVLTSIGSLDKSRGLIGYYRVFLVSILCYKNTTSTPWEKLTVNNVINQQMMYFRTLINNKQERKYLNRFISLVKVIVRNFILHHQYEVQRRVVVRICTRKRHVKRCQYYTSIPTSILNMPPPPKLVTYHFL